MGTVGVAVAVDGAAARWRRGDTTRVSVPVKNVGHSPGQQVVQVYAERLDSVVERPVRWLVGFASVRAEAGKTVDVHIDASHRLLDYWNTTWVREAGPYNLHVGWSSIDLITCVTATI